MAKISIIGSGFVGVTVGKGFLELGYNVIFYDVIDKDLPNFTRDLDYAIENSEISFICVPTPTAGGMDLSYIKNVSERIGKALAKKRDYHVIVIKSTVVPTITETVVIPLIEELSGKKAGEFGVCVNPEFITEISDTWTDDEPMKKDFFTEDRIVIGELDKKSGDVLEEIYSQLKKPIFRVNLKTAEMIKYASNCMLATKISFWNEMFLVGSRLGVDSNTIASIVSLDPRIGRYGAVHGKAFGGKCLPKDLKAFISFAQNYHDTKLSKAVDEINEEMRKKYGVRE